MRRLAIVLAAVTGLLASALFTGAAQGDAKPASAPPKQQWRSYWVDSFKDAIYTPAKVDKLIADAKAVNANALIVQVGRWMDCLCNRSSFPRTHAAIDPLPYDPLDEVIKKGHAAGLEVHAWVNASPMWNATYEPPQPDHIYHSHGPSATGKDRWLGKKFDGSEVGGTTMRVIDPANPAATDYVVDGIASIVRNYDVDGINLDFIRYPDYNSVDDYSDWGYSDVSLDRFRNFSGRTDTPPPSDPQFTSWRREQITGWVRKIYLTMYGIDRSSRLSINGITYMYGPQGTSRGYEATRTYRQVMQDWKGWVQEGIVDLVVTMNYKRETSPGHTLMFEQWSEFAADNQGNRQVATGPGIYLNSLADNLKQARKALAPTAKGNTVVGWSGYAHGVPSTVADADITKADAERALLADALTKNDPTGLPPLFAEHAAVPAMPWKTRPSKGQVVGALKLTDGAPLDQAPVTATNVLTGKRVTGEKGTGRLSDGSGWFGFVDLSPGLWRLEVQLPQGVVGKHSELVFVSKGKLVTSTLGPFRQAG